MSPIWSVNIYVVVVLIQNSPLTAAVSLCYRERERLDSLFTPWRWRPWCPAAVGRKPDCTEWPSAYYHSAQTGQSLIWCLHQVPILRSLIYKIYVYIYINMLICILAKVVWVYFLSYFCVMWYVLWFWSKDWLIGKWQWQIKIVILSFNTIRVTCVTMVTHYC